MPLSSYGQDLLASFAFTALAVTRPVSWWCALHTGNPGVAGSNNEVNGVGYARAAATFTAPSDGVVLNIGDVTFPTSGAAWGTVSWVSLWDLQVNGFCLMYGPLLAPIVVSLGGHVVFPEDTLAINVGE